MIVSDIMATDVSSLRDTDTLRAAVEAILVQRIRHLPVLDAHGHIVGIFTDRDLKHALPSPLSGLSTDAREAVLDENKIGRLMTREPLTLSADTDLARAVELMLERKIGGLPIVDSQGALVGMLTQSDAMRALLGLLA